MRRVFAALLFFMAFTASASADDALSLYQAGKYEPAITAAAVAQNSAVRLRTRHARAALGEALTQKPCLACLQRAEGYARKAIAADTHLPDGHTYLVVCLGYQARIIGTVRARLANYPEESKANLDAALASDPHNVLALMALGGWNIEIAHSGGAVMANLLYGATAAKGMKRTLRPRSRPRLATSSPRYQYALGLGGLDPKTTIAVRSATQLSRASNGTPMTSYESFVQIRARELLAAFSKSDTAEFDRLVRRDQGYP